MFGVINRYFKWLQGNAPQGGVENYPVVSANFHTNIEGLFIIGDLTGVPLLKLAVASGKKVLEEMPDLHNGLLDVVIIGAGPSGVACALQASRMGKKYLLLESNSVFQTIKSYPKGKPIFAEPKDMAPDIEIKIQDGTKESLLRDLESVVVREKLSLLENNRVIAVNRNNAQKTFSIQTEKGETYQTNYVVIAIGKTGDFNKLDVKGESLSHVFYRLIDPMDAKEKHVVIVGGGDSAVEAAISISQFAKNVTLVYRGKNLNRPKQENISRFEKLVNSGKIQLLTSSNISEITEDTVFVSDAVSTKKIKCDFVLVLTGTKPPISFLQKLGIQIQNTKSIRDWVGFTSLLSFSTAAYFGKAAVYGSFWYSYVASAGALIFILTGISWLYLFVLQSGFSIPKGWNRIRNVYLTMASIYFISVYFSATYSNFYLFGKLPSFHYTLLYSLTILVFGIRRMAARPTQYIKWQTLTLITIQMFFLFLLPEIILPLLGDLKMLGEADGFLLTEVFPNGAYWKAYGFILAWPLNMGVLYDGGITKFWFYYGMTVTFFVIPVLVWRYGKGAYCGWICSCGGLAETLGDEHRAKMPHGKWAYALEHSGQWILLLASVLTILKLVGVYGKSQFLFLSGFESSADSVKWIYDLVVDIGLAGVIGVGFYFLFSGRIWCRMFCPLASLMHIYAKFSRFRIFSDKKKCISCNICTQNCHQGIDVMGYANKGIPMDSVQCVRCSACVSLCPTNVLTFGQLVNEEKMEDKFSARLR